MQKEIKNLYFFQSVNFEFIDSSKNNGTKYLLIFDYSSNSKAFVDTATTGENRGLRTFYHKHNLFQQSKLGRDVELQDTHIVLFKSPREVIQVSTLSAQMGLGLKLVDWYRDDTSVSSGHFLFDLSPGTDDRFCYCTNTGSIPFLFYIPDGLKQSKVLDDERKNSLCCPSFPTFVPQMQKSLPSVSP